MNPLFLLLGLLGTGTLSFALAGSSRNDDDTTPVSDDDDDDQGGGVVGDGNTDDDNQDDNDDDDDGGPIVGGDGNGGGNNDDDAGQGDDDNDETPATVGITLVVYDITGDVVMPISDGAALDFGNSDTSDFALGALIDGDAESVVFDVDGETFIQNRVPYNTPHGDMDFTEGSYSITVTAYSGRNGTGEVLGTETFTFDTSAETGDMGGGDMDDDHDGHDMGDDTDDTDQGGDDTSGDGDDHGDHDMGGDDSSGDGDDHGDHDMGGDDSSGDGDDHGDHDMGGDDDDDNDHDHGGGDHPSNHGDHDNTATITPPGVGASQSEINSYLNALANQSDGHSHGNDAGMASEHMAALGLVERGEASHVAIGDGDWDDPSIWSNGQVPGDDAKVLIPEGVTVNYDTVSDARLFTVRIDGKLEFATDTDSQMIFDTMVVAPSGYLEIGNADDPVDPDVNIDLIVANNGRIDTNWDPQLLSRGIISHGKTTIHGAEKDSHDKVTDDPMQGDTSVKMGGVPDGWQVGDTIVIAGTNYDGWSGNREDWVPPEDEVRVITKIDDDGRIHFDEALEFDHDSPRADLKTSVANYTRSVSVESEDGADSEVYERGHVMFMHNDDVDVRYAEFTELGRTDKSEESRAVDEFNSIRFDTNVQGRYSLHLHRTGFEDINDPAILEGNAVFGSPGWGYVHHDSNAILENNASYNTHGAGFVAETGNETGSWVDNIAIYSKGNAWNVPKNSVDIDQFYDIANNGDGFWFQGRMVSSYDNVAASVNHGYVYFHRDNTGTMIDSDADHFAYTDALIGRESVRADDIPILEFDGNETFAANEGMHVVKANTAQGHDVWSHLTDFTAWNVEIGAHLQYTSHYTLENFDLVGKETSGWSDAEYGILIGNNMSDLVIKDATIDGFDTGIVLNKKFTSGDHSKSDHAYFILDADIKNVNREYSDYDSRYDTIMDSSDAPGLEPNIDIDRMVWNDSGDRRLFIEGTKEDGLGRQDFPGGTDEIKMNQASVLNTLETKGYYTTSSGDAYFLVDLYFTDRLTSEVYYETHPVWLGDDVRLGAPKFDNAINLGQQNITTQGGVTRAGDIILDQTFPAPEPTSAAAHASETLSHSATSHTPETMAHSMASHTPETMAMAEAEPQEAANPDEIWLDGYDGEDSLAIAVGDDALFVNTGDASNIDILAAGGETVLASDGSFTVGAGRTLAVFEAAAEVGFDGEDGDQAILELEEDATLLYAAQDGDLGTIEEFDSSATEDEGDVQSGVDLGNAKLSIDLSGLSPEAANAFTLLNADELVGVFNEALVNGLGERDAKVIVDYETDSIRLELAPGEGAVEVETLGAETDVTEGYEDLWQALTQGQAVLSETDKGTMHDEDEHMMHDAA